MNKTENFDRRPEAQIRELTSEEADMASGARFISPGQVQTTVYYDDGISILTSNPATSNLRP